MWTVVCLHTVRDARVFFLRGGFLRVFLHVGQSAWGGTLANSFVACLRFSVQTSFQTGQKKKKTQAGKHGHHNAHGRVIQRGKMRSFQHFFPFRVVLWNSMKLIPEREVETLHVTRWLSLCMLCTSHPPLRIARMLISVPTAI